MNKTCKSSQFHRINTLIGNKIIKRHKLKFDRYHILLLYIVYLCLCVCLYIYVCIHVYMIISTMERENNMLKCSKVVEMKDVLASFM